MKENWEYKNSSVKADNELFRAGTQVAKGGRLCKRSALPKGMVEKRVNSGKPINIG